MATFSWLYENDTDRNRRLQHLARATGRRGARQRSGRVRPQLPDPGRPEKKTDQKTDDDDLDVRLAAAAAARREESGEATRKPAAVAARADEDSRRGKARARRPSPARDDEDLITTAETSRTRKTRRAERSLNWQQALLVVARDALPPLVENDDQANLATLVDTLKRHLDDGGRGPVDEELTTLYRAASAHLKTGARAYAENVGSNRRPNLARRRPRGTHVRRAAAAGQSDGPAARGRSDGVRATPGRRPDHHRERSLARAPRRRLDRGRQSRSCAWRR